MADPILRIAARGDGVAASGRFVAGAVPGDVLMEKGIINPGPHRQPPPCRHFGFCGGCQLQHVDDETYASFVTDRIAEALSAQNLPLPAFSAPHLSPPRTRRRTTLKAAKAGREISIGFAERASSRLVDIHECHVLHPALFELISPLRDVLSPLLHPKRGGTIGLTLVDQGVDVAFAGVDADGLEMADRLNRFANDYGLARLTIDDGFGPQARWEPAPATVTFGEVAVPFPPNGFLQATADGETALVDAVRSMLEGAGMVADLFAGLGTFALSVPGRVYAAEGARDAALALKAAANAAGRPVAVEHRDLFRSPVSSDDLNRFHAVIIDPPRAGAKEQVAELARSRVARIAYVSCNPATFARDAATLAAGGYRLHRIQPVGQFRWSTHVELAAGFTRA